MIRRAVAVVAWLLSLLMTASWAWVIAHGDFMNAMLSAVPAEEQVSLSQD